MEAQPKARLLIVDGHAYAYRAFHAIQKLNGPDGAPTNAIYGFIKMLAKMESTLKPTHHCVVWDGGLCAQRMEALPEYKMQRPPMPNDLERQLPEIESFLEASNIPSFVNDGIEADDWIASQACCAVRADVDVVIARISPENPPEVLYSTTLAKPHPFPSVGDQVILPVHLLVVTLSAGDSVVFTERGHNAVGPLGCWVNLYDNIAITPVPAPGAAGMLVLGVVLAARRRRG